MRGAERRNRKQLERDRRIAVQRRPRNPYRRRYKTTSVASDYSSTITRDDGTTSAGTIAATSGGAFTISASHTFHRAGTAAVRVAVTGPGSGNANSSGTVAVATAGLSVSLASISTKRRNVVLGHGRDSHRRRRRHRQSGFRLSGDGHLGQRDDQQRNDCVHRPGVFAVNASHTFQEPGNRSWSIAITGPGGGTADESSGSATIASAGLTGSIASFIPVEGATFTGVVGELRRQQYGDGFHAV